MREVMIYGDIGPDEWAMFSEVVSAKSVKEQLDALKGEDEILVRINSGGGDVFEAFAIFNLLDQHPSKIRVRVDSVAASAASFIAMAGDVIEMGRHSKMMIHKPMTAVAGNADAMRKVADVLDEMEASLVAAYVDRTGKTPEEIADLLRATEWMGAEAAVEQGFADSLVEGKAARRATNSTTRTVNSAFEMPEVFGAVRIPMIAKSNEEPKPVAEYVQAALARFPQDIS